MFVISVMVMFGAVGIAEGVNVPVDGIEGPMSVTDDFGAVLRFGTLEACRAEARASAGRVTAIEQHVHGTGDLLVVLECEAEKRDL